MLLNLVHHNNRFIRLTAVTWIYEFVMLMGWTIPYARLFRVLLPCYADNEKEVKEKAQATCWELLKSVGARRVIDSSYAIMVETWNCYHLQKLCVLFSLENTAISVWFV